MRFTLSTLLALMLLCGFSQAGICQQVDEGPPQRRWYGGQILMADGLAYTTMLLAIPAGNAGPLFVGGAGYLVSPVVIHAVHGHGLRAGLSVALRLALPLLGGTLTAQTAHCHSSGADDDDPFCGLMEALVGIGLGMVTATVVDASLAWDSSSTVRPDPPPASAGGQSHPGIEWASAGIVATTNGARLVVGGRF